MQGPENPEEEFTFYMKFAKSLVLNLPDPIEKSRAASWLKKLRSVSDADSASLKNDYLKLLLFVLQRKRLVGPFAEMPDYDEPLQPFPDQAGLLEMAKQLISLEATIEEIACGEPNPYMVAVSSDLKEYAVSQEFNTGGAHCYYAVSSEPISEWHDAQKGQYPRGARSHEDSVFDTTAPSTTKCALQFEQMDQSCAEKCEQTFASSPKRKGPGSVVAEGKSQKAVVGDSYRWLSRSTQEQDKTTIDWDPLEGRLEIDKHLETMSRTLEQLQNDSFMKGTPKSKYKVQSAPKTGADFDRNVDDVFGAKFYGAVASVKKICSTEKVYGDGRKLVSQGITQGHSVVSRDAQDGGVSQIHKNMNICDGRRQGTVDRESRGSRRGQRSSAGRTPYTVEEFDDDPSPPPRRAPRGKGCGSGAVSNMNSTHKHLEPGPDETIDINTTADDCNERYSFHRLAPGLEETVEITKTHPRRKTGAESRCPASYEDTPQSRGPSRYDSSLNAGQSTRRSGPALRKLPQPPGGRSRMSQRGASQAGSEQCPDSCGGRRR